MYSKDIILKIIRLKSYIIGSRSLSCQIYLCRLVPSEMHL